jgi:hypothetical protein
MLQFDVLTLRHQMQVLTDRSLRTCRLARAQTCSGVVGLCLARVARGASHRETGDSHGLEPYGIASSGRGRAVSDIAGYV